MYLTTPYGSKTFKNISHIIYTCGFPNIVALILLFAFHKINDCIKNHNELLEAK